LLKAKEMAQPIRSAADFVPERPSLAGLRRAVQSCRGCDLYKGATQGVMGEGPPRARLMLVGEQPGDREDREGHPFVGPAGRLLDRALVAAGIAREQIFVTNAVKHFKWRRGGGKRRLHEKPTLNEARACRPWLEAEAGLLRPAAVVALGATAASTLFGPSARVTTQRGRIFASEWAALSSMTVHPSALLRITDSQERKRAFDRFVSDLRRVREALAAAPRRPGRPPAQPSVG
jgi:DNA polymerase